MLVDRQLMEVDLAEHLFGREGSGLLPRSEQAQLKTYLLEAHDARVLQSVEYFLEEIADGAEVSVRGTDDASLFLMTAHVETERGPQEAGFWLDAANPRYWLLHTKSNAKPAQAALRRLISASKRLDHGWLPRAQLRSIQQFFMPFGFRLGFDERPFYAGYDVVELAEPTHKLSVEHAGVGADEISALLNGSQSTRRAIAVW